MKQTLSVTLCASLLACNASPDYSPYREAVKNRLRDPASAEFRKETIRTLWTSGGKRLRLYCAEVNSNNAFGGKTGFAFAQHVIEAKDLGPYSVHKPGVTFLDAQLWGNYYLNCVRRDTQRDDDEFGKSFVTLSDHFDPAKADSVVPVLSNDVAPELR